MYGEAGTCAVGVISWPSNCSWGDAVHPWKATCVRKCLSSWADQGPNVHFGLEEHARHPWTGGAHSLSFTLQSVLWDLVPTTHSQSVSLLFIFLDLIFSLYISPPTSHCIHHLIFTSIYCLASISWLVIVFLLASIHKWFADCWPIFHTFLHQLLE